MPDKRPPTRARSRLVVGRADDPAERAADTVADLVVRRLESESSMFAGDTATNRIHRSTGRPPIPDGSARMPVQGASTAISPAGPEGGPVSAEVEQRIRRSAGRPLRPDIRGEMEAAFGTDLGRVRVHTGAMADQLSRDLGARAFTTGQDVFFRSGE
jgi:Domain of unknown function (DUF4157)